MQGGYTGKDADGLFRQLVASPAAAEVQQADKHGPGQRQQGDQDEICSALFHHVTPSTD